MIDQPDDQAEDTPPPIDPEDFEAIVAAALKVDPEGIVGQKAKPQDDEPAQGE